MDPHSALLAHVPPLPLVFAGAVGGPACVFALTPLRNAVALGAQDQVSSALQIYRHVFATGGWTGGLATIGPASLQSVALGPLFHFWAHLLGSNGCATGIVGFTETLITYGSQTRNAQLAYNATVSAERQVPAMSLLRPWGPGAVFHVLRNISGMFGLRVIAEPVHEGLRHVHIAAGWAPLTSRLPGDFVACTFSSAVSTAPALLHYFAVTSPEYLAASPRERLTLAGAFLLRQYVVSGPGLGSRPSHLIIRDTALRSLYGASIWTLFGAVERLCVRIWPS